MDEQSNMFEEMPSSAASSVMDLKASQRPDADTPSWMFEAGPNQFGPPAKMTGGRSPMLAHSAADRRSGSFRAARNTPGMLPANAQRVLIAICAAAIFALSFTATVALADPIFTLNTQTRDSRLTSVASKQQSPGPIGARSNAARNRKLTSTPLDYGGQANR